MELIQSMAESILEKVESLIEKKDSGTKVFEARVVEISSSAKVKIKIDGTIHTAKSNIYCEVDDLVRVVAPNNNWKKLYIEANLTSGKTLKDLYESKAQQLTFEDYTSTTYSEDIDTSLAKIVSNGVLGKLFEGIKGSLINLNTRLTSCNNDLKNMNVELTNKFADYLPLRRTLVGQSSNTNLSEKPWFKVATISDTFANNDYHVVFFVRSTYGSGFSGILLCHLRTGSANTFSNYEFYWLCSSGITKENFVLAYNPNVSPCTAEIWCKTTVAWQGIQFDVISEGTRTDFGQKWSLTASGLTNGGYAEITSGYTQIVSV